MRKATSWDLLILDDDWRPLERLPGGQDWAAMVAALYRRDSRWIAIEQSRRGAARPDWADIRLTRALSRRLRPIEVALADHVIHGTNRGVLGRFSFREAGLL